MKNAVEKVEVLDSKSLELKTYNLKDCRFSYRESIFKKNKNLIILSVILKLKKSLKSKIQKQIKEYLDYRGEHQPLNFSSAGSVFKNPSGFSTGELIEKCGLKGKRIGNVKISEKHANFIINMGNGRAEDVKKLINLVKRKVKDKFKINLEEEVQYLGF
jgi:UDP-N-acetylmuramate dehydrogenase